MRVVLLFCDHPRIDAREVILPGVPQRGEFVVLDHVEHVGDDVPFVVKQVTWHPASPPHVKLESLDE